MTRDTYDVTDPAPGPDPERGPHRPDLPVCPHCGGGPAVPVRLAAILKPGDPPTYFAARTALVCKSCARVVA
jgi:hypothetical protein